MTATRQQHRPVRRALGLFCTAFTCLLLLITTLPAPASASTATKVLRYGSQKAAGQAPSADERECRKRAASATASPFAWAGIDTACPPKDFAEGSYGVQTLAVATVPAFGTGTSCIETRGARAPPTIFA